jgi:hypothetical protein
MASTACCARRLGRYAKLFSWKSASNTGSNSSTTAVCTTRSRIVGIPRGLFFPFSFRIYTRLTGLARYSFRLSSPSSSASHRSRNSRSAFSGSHLSPSTPGAPRFSITCSSAAFSTSFRHTSPYRLQALHFGFFLACRYSVLCSFRTPCSVSGSVGVLSPLGPSPRSLPTSDSSAQLPRLRSTPITEASTLLCRTLTPARASTTFPNSGIARPVRGSFPPRSQVSWVTPTSLPSMPSSPTPPER